MGACRSRRLPTWLNALRGEGAGSCCLLPRNSDSRGNLGETTALSAGSRQGVLGGQTVGRGVTRSVRITAGGVEEIGRASCREEWGSGGGADDGETRRVEVEGEEMRGAW